MNKLIQQWESLYGEFEFNKDYSGETINNLEKESGWIRGEIIKTVKLISEPIKFVLLPGEHSGLKEVYAKLLNIPLKNIKTTGLDINVDFKWDFEDTPPNYGKFDLIISQAMLEHLIDPYKHVKDLYNALNNNGHIILHTVIPGFPYHRYPIDCMRFFPDWFEEISKRLNMEVSDKYIGENRIMYHLKKLAVSNNDYLGSKIINLFKRKEK